LKRYVDVDREGNFKTKGNPKVLYSVMMAIRLILSNEASVNLSYSLTIALRYAVVRRQFSNLDNQKTERKLLDYQSHMFKLAPLLAYAYAIRFAAFETKEIYDQL
jgi:acyl-CoA oxidase